MRFDTEAHKQMLLTLLDSSKALFVGTRDEQRAAMREYDAFIQAAENATVEEKKSDETEQSPANPPA